AAGGAMRGRAAARLVALGDDRVSDTPIYRQVGVVPRHAKLVIRVVVLVDEIGDRQVGHGREAVGHAGRDEQPDLVLVLHVHGEGGALGGRPLAEVVQDHPGPAPRHVPVVGLVEVVVQADEATRRLVGAVGLHHLASGREPGPAVALDEAAPFVAVHVGLHHDDAGYHVGLEDGGHLLTL